MIKLIHIDNFFKNGEPERLAAIVSGLNFQPNEFGQEIPEFNLVDPNINDLFKMVLHEDVSIIEERSGIFRKPHTFIHFEDFEHPTDWCFAVALEQSTFNTYHHLTGVDSAMQAYKFNYRNLFEWDYDCNILLKPNQCVFYRPWLFHSFDQGLIHTYRLKVNKNVV